MENRGGCNFYYYVIILLKSRVELGGKYFLESTLTSIWDQPLFGEIFFLESTLNILESTPKKSF